MIDDQKKLATISVQEWQKQGAALFGADTKRWRFVCPVCGYQALAQEWKDAGAPAGAIGFSCVGRWLGRRSGKTFDGDDCPCDYAGGGLFGFNPVIIDVGDGKTLAMMAFVEPRPEVAK